ncbi:MAG: hypothetical protein L7F77_02705 [Candidatus Magnetominusculus sp. LBB02]|nr:hypothetical protein [Candidatus Magnetominusculus sp. LBB02]
MMENKFTVGHRQTHYHRYTILRMDTYYISATPGRLRIQSPRLHNNQNEIKGFESLMAAVAGIEKIETNYHTGSALMYYNQKLTSCERLVGILEAAGYFELMKAKTSDDMLEEGIEDAAKAVIEILGDELP